MATDSDRWLGDCDPVGVRVHRSKRRMNAGKVDEYVNFRVESGAVVSYNVISLVM